MNNQTRTQKFIIYISYSSFLLALVVAALLGVRVVDVGVNNPVSASLLATALVLGGVGFVLRVIAKTNLPSFKPDDDHLKE